MRDKAIWFDMDGTIADLYGIDNWLSKLVAEDETPYAEARPLLNMNRLARTLNHLQGKGYTINIISWTSKNSSPAYAEKVAKAKKKWLKKHLASVHFDNIDIVAYGTPKQVNRNGILFDDEIGNRQAWNGKAYDVNDILNTLKSLA